MAKNNKKSKFDEVIKNMKSGNKSKGEEIHPTSFDPNAPIKKKEFVAEEKGKKKKNKKDKNQDDNKFLIIKDSSKGKSKYKAEVVDMSEENTEIEVDTKDVIEVDFVLVDGVKEAVGEAAKQKPEINTYRKFDKNSKYNREVIGDVRANNTSEDNTKPTYRPFDKNSKNNKDFVGIIKREEPKYKNSSKTNNTYSKPKEQPKATTTTKSNTSSKSNMSSFRCSSIKAKSDIDFVVSEVGRNASNLWNRIKTTPLW